MTRRTEPAPSGERRQVLLFTTRFLPGYKAGGPIKSVVEILDRLPGSVAATVVTADRDSGDHTPYPGLSGRLTEYRGHRVYYMNPRNVRHWLACARAARRNAYDVVYLNSFWSPVFTIVPTAFSHIGLLSSRQLLIAPRGELSPGALRIKSTKKRLFLTLWSRALRRIDPIFHVSTDMEAHEVRRVLPWARTVTQVNTKGAEPRRDIVPSGVTPRFVFISRITPKKNLTQALRALAAVSSPVIFDIYGPLEDMAYWRSCQQEIAKLPSHVQVTYRGALRPEEVGATFAEYDAFIFPTHGENFGHVIAESLAVGCPVVCSAETPWTPDLEGGGGTVVRSDEQHAWARAIAQRAKQSPSEREAAKRSALKAYERWRSMQSDRLAVEVVLDELVT